MPQIFDLPCALPEHSTDCGGVPIFWARATVPLARCHIRAIDCDEPASRAALASAMVPTTNAYSRDPIPRRPETFAGTPLHYQLRCIY